MNGFLTRRLPRPVELALVAGAYFGAGKLGLMLALVNPSATAVWPPTGIALASVLLLGYGVWPAILLGAFLVNLTTAGGIGTSIGIAAGNTLEALLAAWLVGRFARGCDAFDRAHDVFRFALLAGVLSTLASATIGAASLLLGGLAHGGRLGTIWLTWWLGDLGGALVVAPPLLLWFGRSGERWTRRRALEAGALLLITLLVGLAVFGGPPPFHGRNLRIGFLTVPLLVWVAFRFGPREVATMVLVYSAVAIAGTFHGQGPFAQGPLNESLLMLQLYMSVIAVTGLALAALVSERARVVQVVHRAHEELGLRFKRQSLDLASAVQALRSEVSARDRAERFADGIVQTIRDPLLVLDPALRVVSANRAYYQGFRVSKRETKGRLLFELADGRWDIPALRTELEERLPKNTAVEALEVAQEFPGIGLRALRLDARRIYLEGDRTEFVLLAIRDITERRQAGVALRTSEERFRALAETALDGIISADRHGRILYVNPAAERTFGYPAAALSGQPLTRLMPERFHASHERSLARYVATGQTRIIGRTVEMAGRRRDGTEFPVEVSLTSWRIGEELHFTVLLRDITARKQADQKLRESEAQLATAQALAHIGSWNWEVTTDALTWSDELFRIFGLEPGSVPLRYDLFASRLHPDDRERIERTIRRALETGESFAFEHRILRADGSVRWLHGQGEVTMGEHGVPATAGPVHIYGTAQDITDRKLAEAALRESEARFRRLVDSNIIGVVVADTQGRLHEANQAFLDMTGYSREELAAGARPDWRILDKRAIEQIGERGIATTWETEFVRRDGSRIPILVGAALLDAGGGQCICFILDQTERKRAEERLLMAYDELEVRVHERTAQLSLVNADLKQEIADRRHVERVLERRTRELARSNADLEQFASAAAHDLQEPLRTVTSYVQLLAKRYRGRLDPEADEFIEFAVDGVARMRALIHDLLAYSRVGTVGLRLEPTDCGRVLERALANLQAAIEESGAGVTHDPLPAVEADGAQLVQLFQNLIGNAIKFRGEQPLRVHVRAERDGSDWRFSFKDNAQGIDAKHLERIFVVFQRLHNREQYPGTGIGLAICRKIVERHGGRMWAESEPGRGSEFWFTLPTAAAERWVPPSEQESTSAQDSADVA